MFKDKLLKIINPLIKVIVRDIKKNTDDIVKINERLNNNEESKIYKPKELPLDNFTKPDYDGQIGLSGNNIYIAVKGRWCYIKTFEYD